MKKTILCCLIWSSAFSLHAQTLYPLGDLYKPGLHPFEFTSGPFYTIHDNILFYGLTYSEGYGFWSYDGQDAQWISEHGSYVRAPVETTNGYYFISPYDEAKYDLFFHGGQPGVTLLLDDVQSNSSNNVPTIATANGKVFYQNWEASTGYELWSARDSAGSGALVADSYPGTGGTYITELTSAEHLVYYRGGGTNGKQLWRSDGTEAGTFLLLKITANNQNIQAGSLKVMGDKAYFLLRKYSGETELWQSDGTVTGTVKTADVPSCMNILDYFEAFFLNGRYVYLANYPQSSNTVWVSTDGSTPGTEYLMSLPVNANDVFSYGSGSKAQSVLNGSFFFFYHNDATQKDELWKSDGTATGTMQVKVLEDLSGPHSLSSTLQSFFFLAFNQSNQQLQLWASDGTDIGTKLVKSLGATDDPYYPSSSAATDSSILFQNPFYGPDVPRFPYRSDGTEQGTYPLQGSVAAHWASAYPQGFEKGLNDAVYFRANSASDTVAVWRCAPNPPFALSPIDTINAYTYQLEGIPISISNRVLWFQTDSTLRVWDENGTLSSLPVPAHSGTGWEKGPGGTFAYFLADYGRSLWRSDGTQAGTSEVFPAPLNSQFYNLKTAGDSIYFVQRYTVPNQPFDQALWSSDGTAAGTQAIAPLSDGSTVFLRSVSGALAYSLYDYMTQDKTLYLRGFPPIVFPGLGYEEFAGMTVANGHLFLLGPLNYATGTPLHSLWRVENGQPVWLYDFAAVGEYNLYSFDFANSLHPIGDKVVFGAGLKKDNVELWVSDGTPGGTFELRDLNPGGSGSPDNFVRYNDALWLFTANDGTEVAWWATDGTSNGTFKVASLASVKDYFVPNIEQAYLYDKRLYFSMNDGLTGQEPWLLVLEDSLVVSTLAPLQQADALQVWPNPAHDQLQIQFSGHIQSPVQLEILDALGRTVQKQTVQWQDNAPFVWRIPPANAGPGFIVLRAMSADGKIWTQKVLVQP